MFVYLLRVFLCVLAFGSAVHAQTHPKMSSSEALVRDLDTAKSMGGIGRLLIEQDGRTRRWPDYCGASLAATDRGEFREAVRQAARAVAIGEKTNDNEAMFFASRDMTYAYFMAGDTTNALYWMERTAQAYNAVGFRDSSQAASPMLIRSKLMFSQGKYKEALEAATKSWDSLPAFGASERVGAAKMEVAAAHIALGNETAGMKIIQEVANSGSALNKSRALSEWARSLLRAGNAALAKEKAEEAVKVASKEGELVQAGLLKILAEIQAVSGDKVAAIASYTKAIEFVTRSRGKFSSQAVRSGLLTSNQILFDDAIQLAMEMGSSEKAILWSEASRSQLTMDQLRERQAVKLPVMTGLDDLLKQSKDMQFLVFHSTSKNTFAWLIEGGQLRAQTVKLDKSELIKAIEDFRNQIVAGGISAHAPAFALYNALIAPLKPMDKLPIVIVPSGPLHLLPFQALRSSSGWLAQQNAIRYEISLATAAAPNTEKRLDSLFAVGNPTLPNPAHSLPGAELEVKAIKGFFQQSVLALKADATRSKFMSEAGKAGFVHAAAHVTMDELDPMLSAIKLSAQGKESGDVLATDFLTLDLKNVSLVALSACNSGMGRIAPGDEFYGFKRSILLSGAKSLALTYWAVDDDSTAELMMQFYKFLREEKLPAHLALQKAQSAMIQGGKFVEPYHWASFMLVGTFLN